MTTANIIPINPRRREQLHWIIRAVDSAVSRLNQHTDADISAAAKAAADSFNRGESGARCIEHGVIAARQSIAARAARRPSPPFSGNVIDLFRFLSVRIL